MNKLNIVIMGQNCERYLKMCLESVKGENIIYLDGGSTDTSLGLAKEYKAKILQNSYDQNNAGMNGIQRNVYLKYLKENHMGEWALVLDADEVVEDIKIIHNFIEQLKPEHHDFLISLKMRHFIGSLGNEDSTEKEHLVQHRLFKVKECLEYPEIEHPVLWVKGNHDQKIGNFKGTTIWHLGYAGAHIFDIRKRYKSNLKKSKTHSKEYLDDWYFSHLFGVYPTKPIKAIEIPPIILKEFMIEPDKIYFMTHRRLELKHFLMMREWKNHFKPKTMLDLGCGLGLFGFAADSMGIKYKGIEKSKWAVDNRKYTYLDITQGDIRDKHDFKDYDLVLVFDVLEHLEEKDLDRTLENIKDYGKNFLFSFPVIGNPNLPDDPTHKIHKSKEWWIKALEKHFKLEPTPDFMFKEQIFIGRKR